MKKPLVKNNTEIKYLLSIISFTLFSFMASCSNNPQKQNNQSKQDTVFDKKIEQLKIDTISDDIGVVVITDSLNLYASPSDTDFIGCIVQDQYKPKLIFTPHQLESYFKPLYFRYSGDREDLKNPEQAFNTYIIRDLTFRVIDKNNNWMKIVLNEDNETIAYIRNEIEVSDDSLERELFYPTFYTWNDYFKPTDTPVYNREKKRIGTRGSGKGYILIDHNKNLVFYADKEGNTIYYDGENSLNGLFCDSIVGDWMKIKVPFVDIDTPYWIKWRDGRKLLINYNETWGLE